MSQATNGEQLEAGGTRVTAEIGTILHVGLTGAQPGWPLMKLYEKAKGKDPSASGKRVDRPRPGRSTSIPRRLPTSFGQGGTRPPLRALGRKPRNSPVVKALSGDKEWRRVGPVEFRGRTHCSRTSSCNGEARARCCARLASSRTVPVDRCERVLRHATQVVRRRPAT